MTQEHGLVTMEQKPEAVVIAGTDAATQLQKIVGSRQKKLMMGGKQYLFFEDWQTIGKFYGVTARVSGTSELRENDQLIGFLASAVAIVGGVEISGADAECTFDEPNWIGKPRYQLRSMAQTRACAKALRNCLGWVAVLAGYEATPAEEMSGVSQERGHQPQKSEPTSEHFCQEHGVKFFKTAKMRSYAHPIGDTGEWCHEHTSSPVIEATESISSPVEEKTSPVAPRVKPIGNRDATLLRTLGEMQKACHTDFELQPAEVLKILGAGKLADITISPAECYEFIKDKLDEEMEPEDTPF